MKQVWVAMQATDMSYFPEVLGVFTDLDRAKAAFPSIVWMDEFDFLHGRYNVGEDYYYCRIEGLVMTEGPVPKR